MQIRSTKTLNESTHESAYTLRNRFWHSSIIPFLFLFIFLARGDSRPFEFERRLFACEKTLDAHTHSRWPPLSETALCFECRAEGLRQIYNREWRSVRFLSPTELITLIRLLNCMHYNSGFRGEEQTPHTLSRRCGGTNPAETCIFYSILISLFTQQ